MERILTHWPKNYEHKIEAQEQWHLEFHPPSGQQGEERFYLFLILKTMRAWIVLVVGIIYLVASAAQDSHTVDQCVVSPPSKTTVHGMGKGHIEEIGLEIRWTEVSRNLASFRSLAFNLLPPQFQLSHYYLLNQGSVINDKKSNVLYTDIIALPNESTVGM